MALDIRDWHRFDVPRLHPDHAKLLATYAGPKVFDGQRVYAGDNCAWLVWQFLTTNGYVPNEHFRWTPPPRPNPLDSMEALMCAGHFREFRPTVKGIAKSWPDYVTSWQADFSVRFSNRNGAHLWWKPGSGKTLGGTLWASLHPGPIVYVTRSSVRFQVATETRRYTYMEPFVISGEKPVEIPPTSRFIVLGWEVLLHHVDAIERLPPGTVIFDESHRAASWKRRVAVPKRDGAGGIMIDERGEVKMEFRQRKNRAAAAERLSRWAARRVSTTGSPLPDGRVRNLWAQLDLSEPEQWGTSFYTYAKRYADAKDGVFGGIDSSGRASTAIIQELTHRLTWSVHYVPAEVINAGMPERRREVIYVPKDELLKEIGKEARDVLRDAAKNGPSALAWARMAMTAVQKRPYIVEWVKERALAADGAKLGTKFVIVTGLRGEAAKLHEALRKGLPDDFPTWFGTGDHSGEARETMRNAYMAAPAGALVGTMEAWGESYNLQDTDFFVACMLPYTPRAIIQWEGRGDRLDATRRPLFAYFVGEGTYDEHVASILYSKFDTLDAVAPAKELAGFGKQIVGIANEEEIVDSLLGKLSSSDVDLD